LLALGSLLQLACARVRTTRFLGAVQTARLQDGQERAVEAAEGGEGEEEK
jgi:hypothetical protein